MGLRWGVAGVVSAIPLVGFVSFLLPALGFDEEKDEDDAARLKLLSAVFAVASLSQGLNLGSAGAWGVAAACAATLQLERLGRESRALEAHDREAKRGGGEEAEDPRAQRRQGPDRERCRGTCG